MLKEVRERKNKVCFPIEACGSPALQGKIDPWGRELGSGSSGKGMGMGEAPIPVSLPEDAGGDSVAGVLPPSCSQELPSCSL